MLFIVITTWIVTIRNPSILGMIETMGAPMIAAILFILPVVSMNIVPAMKNLVRQSQHKYSLLSAD